MTRIQIEISDERLTEIEQLMNLTGIVTKKSLINDALTLYEWAVNQRSAGRIVASLDESTSRYKELLMASLEYVRPRSSTNSV